MRSERRTVTSCKPQQQFTTASDRHSVASVVDSETHHRGTENTERNTEERNTDLELRLFVIAGTDRLADSAGVQPASFLSVSSVSPW